MFPPFEQTTAIREYEVPDYLAVLDEFVTSLGLEKAHIPEHHSGASFTREFAAHYPERTGKIILSDSTRPPPNPKNELLKAKEFLSQPYARELKLDRVTAIGPHELRSFCAACAKWPQGQRKKEPCR